MLKENFAKKIVAYVELYNKETKLNTQKLKVYLRKIECGLQTIRAPKGILIVNKEKATLPRFLILFEMSGNFNRF
ncbi:unnamed protein product [Rhizophagus irregularis]|nr:unnamed protein product [Rhizophagus irregularis]